MSLTTETAGRAEQVVSVALERPLAPVRPFRNLLNVAVGGNWGGQHGVDDAIWPARTAIDYVRVLQRTP